MSPFWVVLHEVREWVMGRFPSAAKRVKVLRGKYHEEVKKLKAADEQVWEDCWGKK